MQPAALLHAFVCKGATDSGELDNSTDIKGLTLNCVVVGFPNTVDDLFIYHTWVTDEAEHKILFRYLFDGKMARNGFGRSVLLEKKSKVGRFRGLYTKLGPLDFQSSGQLTIRVELDGQVQTVVPLLVMSGRNRG